MGHITGKDVFADLEEKIAGLMSEVLRSRFLFAMKTGVKIQGKGWLLDV
jgi:hypothetical protein